MSSFAQSKRQLWHELYPQTVTVVCPKQQVRLLLIPHSTKHLCLSRFSVKVHPEQSLWGISAGISHWNLSRGPLGQAELLQSLPTVQPCVRVAQPVLWCPQEWSPVGASCAPGHRPVHLCAEAAPEKPPERHTVLGLSCWYSNPTLQSIITHYSPLLLTADGNSVSLHFSHHILTQYQPKTRAKVLSRLCSFQFWFLEKESEGTTRLGLL